MPPPLLVDLASLDLDTVLLDRQQVQEYIPQRYEIAQIDGILHVNADSGLMVGFKDVREDEWWVRGHMPGRPLLPGVLMIEAAAQLAAFYTSYVLKHPRMIGFGGVDKVKFREQVVPPTRLILIGQAVDTRPRRIRCQVQGVVQDRLAFEAEITGMPI
jgi:3-hydroxyacyl-[acyl-carrier-protein] dehydratase